jgi:non-specific serine/threonine protein kinase
MNVLVTFPGREPASRRRQPGRQLRERSRKGARHGFLPHPPTPLIGREPELAVLEHNLQGGDVSPGRLITLVGAPGTGKTRLAIATAERVVESYDDGVYFVDLTTLTEAEAVPAAIAHSLGATYRGHRPVSLEETLKRALRDRRLLLVLDNFEVVLGAGALIEDLVASCPRLRVMVTSRASLRTATEHQFEVPPLAMPDLDAIPALDELVRIESVELFVARVQPLRPGWQLTQTNARAVAEICVRLDGLPLAIELAASWMNVLSPQEMLKELPRSMSRLDRGGGTGGRHQTLEATIGWSYDLLSKDEQQLFRRLSVFESGWTFDSCVAVCADAGTDRASTLSLLGSLVDKHLVTRREDADGSVRFGLLETIHAYSSRGLEESGELQAIKQRHAAAFADLAEGAERELDSPAQSAWVEVLEQERGNLRSALDWARTAVDPDAAHLGLRIAATLWLLWDVRGHVQEGREPLRELLEHPGARVRSMARARALLAQSWLGYVRGDVDEVERVTDEVLSISEQIDNTQMAARALSILGTTLSSYAQQFERTETVLQRSLELSQPLGDTWSIGFALYSLGTLAMRRGQLPEAIQFYEACRDVSARTGNTFGIGCSVFRLGVIAGARGDQREAVRLLRQAVELHWALRNRRVLALCLQQLACTGTGLLEPDDQARMFASARVLFEQLPDYVLPEYLVEAERQGTDQIRNSLGEARFGEAWADGRKMSLREIVQLALGTSTNTDDAGRALPLTGREIQICRLVADGLTNREIGLRLGLSHHTVDNHLRRIFGKVGVTSRTGLATWSVRSGVSRNGPEA